ncbi:MAG: hypothetical protein RIB59_17550 [Rhodospirillales bacterium]
MTKQPDLDDLARQYLDLWQDQLTGMAQDPEVTEMMARTVELMNTNMAAFTLFAQSALNAAAKRPDGTKVDGDDQPASQRRTKSATAGSAAAAAASGDSDLDVDELLRRIETLEKRIAALEGGTAKKRGSPRKSPKRRRS